MHNYVLSSTSQFQLRKHLQCQVRIALFSPGSPTYIPGQTTSTYRATAASTYGPNIGQAPLRTTNNYIAPQYVNNSQVGAQGYVNTQQRQTNTQQYTTTTYDNRGKYKFM